MLVLDYDELNEELVKRHDRAEKMLEEDDMGNEKYWRGKRDSYFEMINFTRQRAVERDVGFVKNEAIESLKCIKSTLRIYKLGCEDALGKEQKDSGDVKDTKDVIIGKIKAYELAIFTIDNEIKRIRQTGAIE